MRLDVAELYWKNHRFSKGFVEMCHAIATRPRIAGRPLRRLFHRDVVRTGDAC
jgi:hypothetical protein